ncbi:MAG TPA: hemerythrin domain-containing protein, partial [Kofleriaceae bacterium]
MTTFSTDDMGLLFTSVFSPRTVVRPAANMDASLEMLEELASLTQLEKCHRRHDDVMEGLLEAARRLAAGRPDTGDVDTVREAVAYFKRSITRHFLDEEGSLFPRLSTRRPELAEQLAALSAEHPSQVALQDQIGELA